MSGDTIQVIVWTLLKLVLVLVFVTVPVELFLKMFIRR